MTPKPFTSRRRDPALDYTLGETALVLVAMSLLPLAAFVAVAFPVATLATVGSATAGLAGLTVGPRVAALLRSSTGKRTVCVPSTGVCVEV